MSWRTPSSSCSDSCVEESKRRECRPECDRHQELAAAGAHGRGGAAGALSGLRPRKPSGRRPAAPARPRPARAAGAGPGSPTAHAETVVVPVRRYRCLPCGAVLVVVPREVRARRLYSAAAIGLALALWGLGHAAASEVRRRISPTTILGDAAVTGWVTLRRWARAVAQRRLFAATPLPAPGATLRRVAASAASALAASAAPTTRGEAIEHRAFLGAAHSA